MGMLQDQEWGFLRTSLARSFRANALLTATKDKGQEEASSLVFTVTQPGTFPLMHRDLL